MTAVDPSSLTFRHDWGTPLLAAAHAGGTSVLFRGEDDDLIVVADLADGSGMGLEGDVDGCGKGEAWFVGGTLPERVAAVHVRDGDAWVRALISPDERVWLAVIRAEQEIVRFEDAAGEIVSRPRPEALVGTSSITDAWTACPACGACAWEHIRREEHWPDYADDPEFPDPWVEEAARCVRCGHRVLGVSEPDGDEEELPQDTVADGGFAWLEELLAAGRLVYELENWAGDRRLAGVFGYVPEGEPPNHVVLEFSDGGRRVSIVTLHVPSVGDEGPVVTVSIGDDEPEFAPDPARSALANALAEVLFYDELTAAAVESPEREIRLELDGSPVEFLVGERDDGWVAHAQPAHGVSVAIEGHGVAPETCALRSVRDAGAYAG